MKSKTSAILIVDDSPNDLHFISRAFRKLNIPNPVHCVHSGNEAIRYLNGGGEYADRAQFPYPTFILTDLKMPDGDGFTLLQNIKSKPRWAVIPTIMLSGAGDTDDIKKAFLLGASAYFVKPATLDGYEKMARVTYDFWNMSETPEVDEKGQQLHTESEGKLGERIPQADYQESLRRSG